MWDTYLDCKTWGGRPSQRFSWPCLANRLTAWKFDGAVLFVGLVIENALQERRKVSGKDGYSSEPRYKLSQLLAPDFRLPPPDSTSAAPGEADAPQGDGLAWMMALARQPNSGVKAWQYVPPAPEQAV